MTVNMQGLDWLAVVSGLFQFVLLVTRAFMDGSPFAPHFSIVKNSFISVRMYRRDYNTTSYFSRFSFFMLQPY